MTELTLTYKSKYKNREGHTVQVIQTAESNPAGLFKIKNLRNGWEYWVGKNGRYQSDETPHKHRLDVVDVYTMPLTKDHLLILGIIQKQKDKAFDRGVMEVLMDRANRPPSLYQAELRIKELVDNAFVEVRQRARLKHYTLTDKALAILNVPSK